MACTEPEQGPSIHFYQLTLYTVPLSLYSYFLYFLVRSFNINNRLCFAKIFARHLLRLTVFFTQNRHFDIPILLAPAFAPACQSASHVVLTIWFLSRLTWSSLQREKLLPARLQRYNVDIWNSLECLFFLHCII